MRSEQAELRLGQLSAVLALVLWGVFPLFWRQFGSMDPLQVVCHRVLWAFVFLFAASPWLFRNGDVEERRRLRKSIGRLKIWSIYSLAGVLIAVNWLTFVWAVNHDRVLEASLGYYINPLLSVVLGVLVLGERLRPLQWLAVGIAALGVVVMTVSGGGLPWSSLVLACTFALYALVKKRAPLPALVGLLFETTVLVLPAATYIFLAEIRHEGVLGNVALISLLVAGGPITIMPLALFAYAARRVPLSMVGLLQYIAPTMQFLIGAVVLSEPFDRWRLAGFVCVWVALGIYIVSSQRRP